LLSFGINADAPAFPVSAKPELTSRGGVYLTPEQLLEQERVEDPARAWQEAHDAEVGGWPQLVAGPFGAPDVDWW
jgi:hypothetical protein